MTLCLGVITHKEDDTHVLVICLHISGGKDDATIRKIFISELMMALFFQLAPKKEEAPVGVSSLV